VGDLSEHFSRSEFACKCGCGLDTVDYELIIVLEGVSKHFDNSPITVNSGCRCEEHNKSEGGWLRSKHLNCRAADIRVKGVSPDKVHAYLTIKYPNKYGIGKYDTFTHIDTRSGRGRWNG